MLALILGINKDQLREVADDFFEEEFLKPDGSSEFGDIAAIIEPHVQKVDRIDDPFGDDGEEDLPNFDSDGFLTWFLNQPGIVRADGTLNQDFGTVNEQLASFALKVAGVTDRLVTETRRKSRDEKPNAILKNVRREIESLKAVITEQQGDFHFKKGELDYDLNKAVSALDEIKKIVDSQ